VAPTVADALSQTAKLDPSNQPRCLLIQNFHRGRDKLGFDVDPTAFGPRTACRSPRRSCQSAGPALAGQAGLRDGRSRIAAVRPGWAGCCTPATSPNSYHTTAQGHSHTAHAPVPSRAVPGPPCGRSHCRRDAINPQRARSVIPCPVGESVEKTPDSESDARRAT
jgi:hypothetical protein